MMDFIEWFVENENTIMHCIVAIAITLQVVNNQMIFRRLDSHDRELFSIHKRVNKAEKNKNERENEV